MKEKGIWICCLLLAGLINLRAQPEIGKLRTEYLANPLGLDCERPRLSWIITSDAPGSLQQAYEIRSALDERDLEKGRKLLWETGWVESDRSTLVPYDGPDLESLQRVYWQVRIRDNHGKKSSWSTPACWEMGLLDPLDWKAAWISPPWKEDPAVSNPSPYMRRAFSLKGKVHKASLVISSHGLYQAEINGEKVDDQLFTPGWTSYHKRLQYQVYDVSSLLRSGENVIGVVLGDGWFRGRLAWSDRRNVYGEKLALVAQLHVSYADGSGEVIISDENWKASTGPILESDIYNGELYDANREMEGWSRTGFDDQGWEAPLVVKIPTDDRLVATTGPGVRVINDLKPVSVEKREEGWLVDMGQNMVGWISIGVAGGTQGDTLTIRHAEVLDRSGNIYYENLRAAKQTNRFIMRGGEEEFEPHFTFQGFRYIMVSGYPGELTPDKVTGRVIHSDMEPAGTFTCSDPLINQLQHNILWGLKGNFLDVPTDCPQRDERLGWTGDAQVFAPTAIFNRNAAAFYSKWMRDMAADQHPSGLVPDVVPDVLGGGAHTGWADAAIVIPWTVYLYYGDVRILQENYALMANWIAYMEERAGEDLVWDGDWHYGDWLSYSSNSSSYPGAHTHTDLIATAYFFRSTDLMRRISGILGNTEDELRYMELAGGIRQAFNREFVTPAGRLVSHTQTAYTLALAFGLLDETREHMAAGHLARDVEGFGHITTGFLGTPLISAVLSEYGRNDLAYLLLMRREYPSWLYPVTRGATTIWERWDGLKPDSTFQDKGMNSFNHYAYGAIGDWLYSRVAGIGLEESLPGYKHIIIRPQPGGGLSSARATHESPYGTIVSGWELEGDRLSMEVEIPVNTTATLYIPGVEGGINVRAPGSGESFQITGKYDGGVKARAGSGHYRITSVLPLATTD